MRVATGANTKKRLAPLGADQGGILMSSGVQRGLAAIFSAMVGGAVALAAQAQDAASFYKGKTMNIVVGYGPGGGFDIYARLIAEYLPRHIPGRPSAIVQNMPGAATLKSTSYIYKIGPQDGTVLGIPNQGVPLNALLWGEVGDGFEIAKFNWIGRLDNIDLVGVVWHSVGIKSIEEIKHKEVIFGATSDTGVAFLVPAALNTMLHTKFKLIKGYKDTGNLYLAMEQGEIQGVGNAVWSQVLRSRREWIDGQKVYPLFQASSERAEALPDVPTIIELADNEDDRRVMRLLASTASMGRSLMAGPKVPAERVATLRQAFRAMMTDAAFQAEAEKQKLPLAPLYGQELQAMIEDLANSPDAVLQRTRALIGK